MDRVKQVVDTQDQSQTGLPSEMAVRMLELIHDLGDCEDSRQVLISTTRHLRVLFGDYWAASLLVDDPDTGHWRVLPLENPYESTWGGVPHHLLPPNTDMDEIVRLLGTEAHSSVTSEGVLVRAFLEQTESFVAVDSALAIRISAMMGAPCRTFVASSWKRPRTGKAAWMILGFPEPIEFSPSRLKLYETTVHTMARLAAYPALVNYIERTEKTNASVRRNIVHDLKTPITVIKGYMETLMIPEVSEDQEMKDELEKGIVESCDRLLEDIGDLLEPVAKAWIPEKTEFDISLLLHKAVLAEKHTDRASNHSLILEGADSPLLVRADLRKIRRVIENLLSNAVKYSPGEDKSVWVQLKVRDVEIEVTFRDEGIGLDDIQMAKVINEAGRVVDPALGIEGTGFGLSSTRAVLEAHKGRLVAESTVGVGSSFGFVLPL